jgi:hypothetical protein
MFFLEERQAMREKMGAFNRAVIPGYLAQAHQILKG